MATTFNPHPSTRVVDAFPGPVRYHPEPLNLARGDIRARLEEISGHLYAASQLAKSIIHDDPRYRHGIVARIARTASQDAELAEGAASWMPRARAVICPEGAA